MIHLLKVGGFFLPLNHYTSFSHGFYHGFSHGFYPLKNPLKPSHERLTYAEQLSTCPAAWAALAMPAMAGLACPGWRRQTNQEKRCLNVFQICTLW